jgi:hypothetical protein
VQWVKQAAENQGYNRVAAPANGVAVVGTESQDRVLTGLLQVFDNDGQVVLEKHFESRHGGRAIANAVAVSKEGRLFVAVNDEDAEAGLAEAYVVELTRDGEELWRSSGMGLNSSIVGLSVRDGCSVLVAGSRWEEIDGETRDVGLAAEVGL